MVASVARHQPHSIAVLIGALVLFSLPLLAQAKSGASGGATAAIVASGAANSAAINGNRMLIVVVVVVGD